MRGEAKLAVEKLCAGCQDGRDQYYANQGLRSPSSFVGAGNDAMDAMSYTEAVRCFVMGGEVEKACEAAVAGLHAIMGSESWEHAPAKEIIMRLGHIFLPITPYNHLQDPKP